MRVFSAVVLFVRDFLVDRYVLFMLLFRWGYMKKGV